MNQQEERDRFELLSAYIDGEVTAKERQEVEQWLACDPKAKTIHSRLVRLREEISHLPCGPYSDTSCEELSNKVFNCIEKQERRKRYLWGGGAIAALTIAAISQLLPQSLTPSPQTAQNNPSQSESGEQLMLAVNRPPVAIPAQLLQR